MKNIKKIYYTIGVFVLFLILLSGCTSRATQKEDNIPADRVGKTNDIVELGLVFESKTFDFGLIKQSAGKVSHDFSFTYNGSEPIKITGVPTSCACTSAKITPTNLEPGESGVLTIVFNPNLHEEPEGRFFKTAIVLTEPELTEEIEVKIWAEIDLDLGEDAFELKDDHDDADELDKPLGYTPVTAEILDKMLQKKDFVLIDVHIPEQIHIVGTDLFIPYNDIERFEDKLPKDKDAKIVLYCNSGSMSRAASYVLNEHGYTNVYDLIGGKIAYDDFLDSK